MKKILSAIIVSVFALSGCVSEESPEAYLEIVSVDKEFSAAGGAGEVVISTSAKDISAVSDKSWLTVDGADATSVRFTVGQSDNEFSRTANITISADGASQVVNVVQMGAILSVDDEPLEIGAGGGEITIECYSNIAGIKVEIDRDWLSYTVENSTIVLSAGPNLEGRDLSATVSVGGTWKDPIKITVTQPMVTIFEQRTLAFSKDEGSEELLKTEFYDEVGQGFPVRLSLLCRMGFLILRLPAAWISCYGRPWGKTPVFRWKCDNKLVSLSPLRRRQLPFRRIMTCIGNKRQEI